jgi:predicted thioredoxin/glutaredoxin
MADMTKISLFADTSCSSCESTEKELKNLLSRRNDVELIIFRRPEDFDKFKEYHIAICPAVFVDQKFVSYGSPDIRKLESALDARRRSRNDNAQLKTKTKGEVE